MSKTYIAFYKKKRKVTNFQTLRFRIFDAITKIVTLGEYSHCEIVYSNGTDYNCYSSSNRDGGVRFKTMPLPYSDWDFLDISHLITPDELNAFYNETAGMSYDFIGLISPVVGNIHDKNKYFCSEWCADALGIKEPNKLSPIALYRVASKMR